MHNDHLTFLGVLAAPTKDGKRAVAIALTGAVELYHFVDAGLDAASEDVKNWLWTAGINPEEASTALPPPVLIKDILLPAIGRKALVVHHGDMGIPFVDELVRALATTGNSSIISGLDLDGPIAQAVNGAAGRRAFALQASYEAALHAAIKSPAIHSISGELGPRGDITHISVAGPFSKRSWTIDSEVDALACLISIMHLGDFAAFVVADGPAQAKIRTLANQLGLDEKFAA